MIARFHTRLNKSNTERNKTEREILSSPHQKLNLIQGRLSLSLVLNNTHSVLVYSRHITVVKGRSNVSEISHLKWQPVVEKRPRELPS